MGGDRVDEVQRRRAHDVAALVSRAGLRAAPAELYLRAFKQEQLLEVWGGPAGAPLALLASYPICAASGDLGPKRREGDLQVPEGLYAIDGFNPASNFHLSLKVSYPNAADALLSDRHAPGGLIYLHGGCASIGCIAITDPSIEEVYLLALKASVRPIRFDIYPFRLEADATAEAGGPHADFWRQLAPAYASFEATHRPAPFRVDAKTGAYRVMRQGR